MKATNNMMIHSAFVLKNLIIGSAMTAAEMKFNNTHLGMVKIITGTGNFFIAGNGIGTGKTNKKAL